MNETNKGGAGKANIKAGKKTDARFVTSTNNSIDGGVKLTNQYVGLAVFAIVTLTAANYIDNSYLAICKETFLSAANFIPQNFSVMFTIFANIFLERKKRCMNLIHFYLPLTTNSN